MSNKPLSAFGLAGLALATLGFAIGGALVSPPASASGFQVNENTVKAMGRAYAGRETAGNDVSVVMNNPAAMADFNTYALQVDATAIDPSFKFHGTGTDAIGFPLSGGNGGDGGDLSGVPAISFIAPIAQDWRLGFAINAPYGLKTEYNDGWMGRYQALKSSLKTIDLTGSVSWAVSPEFALGFSVIAQQATADLGNAVNLGAVMAAPPFNLAPTFLPQSADGAVRVRGDDWEWGWQLGAQWKPTAQDTLGVSYRSRITHHINGQAWFTVPQSVAFVLSQPGLPPLFQNTAASAELATPASVSMSYWHKTLGPVSWGAELAWTGWDSFRNLAIDFSNPYQPDVDQPFNWRNTWFGSVGADYQVNNEWTLRGGLGYDQTPTRDSTRDPRLPDGNRTWLSFGATYTPAPNVEFNFGYSHLFVDDGDVNDISATGDHLIGSFDNSADLFGISATFKF